MLIDYDEIIALSQLKIHIQTTSGGGLTGFAFNSNRLDANSINANRFAFNAHYFCRVDRPFLEDSPRV